MKAPRTTAIAQFHSSNPWNTPRSGPLVRSKVASLDRQLFVSPLRFITSVKHLSRLLERARQKVERRYLLGRRAPRSAARRAKQSRVAAFSLFLFKNVFSSVPSSSQQATRRTRTRNSRSSFRVAESMPAARHSPVAYRKNRETKREQSIDE